MQSLNTSTLLDQCMGLQGQKINAWGSAVAWAPAAKCSAAMAAPDLSCVGLCGWSFVTNLATRRFQYLKGGCESEKDRLLGWSAGPFVIGWGEADSD